MATREQRDWAIRREIGSRWQLGGCQERVEQGYVCGQYLALYDPGCKLYLCKSHAREAAARSLHQLGCEIRSGQRGRL